MASIGLQFQQNTEFSHRTESDMEQLWTALSIKQPWAALIVHGIKTIEIRTWFTGKKGLIAIHASKSPEADPQAWRHVVAPAVMETAGLVGGVIGYATLRECITYSSCAAFDADATRHCAGPERFKAPRTYGFRFSSPRLTRFVPCVGNTNFFTVRANLRVTIKPRRKQPEYVVRLPEESP